MDLFLTAAVDFCTKTANIWQIVGYVLLVFKIVIPLLLIIFGMIDLGKAVIASKSDEVKKATTSLAFRAVAAVAIFLIPTIIGVVMGFVSDFSESGAKADFDICKACITRPNNKSCDNKADAAWEGKTSTSSSEEE